MKYWIYVADAQVDYSPRGLPERNNDFHQALINQARLAAADPNCLGLIGGGDMREFPLIHDRGMDTLTLCCEILRATDKTFLAYEGNHDTTNVSWIRSMRQPNFYDFTDPAVQEKFGFDPKTTWVANAQRREHLHETLAELHREGRTHELRTIFLHQALAELTAKKFSDLSINDLTLAGIGNQKGTTHIFLGDLHNYGDVKQETGKDKFIEAAYPGSLEMTDVNEGYPGLTTDRYKVDEKEPNFSKYVLHLFPDGKGGIASWKRVQAKCRPWAYVYLPAKMKTKLAEVDLAVEEAMNNWKDESKYHAIPGVLQIIIEELPRGGKKAGELLEQARKVLAEPEVAAKLLYGNVRLKVAKKTDETTLDTETGIEGDSWGEAKKGLHSLVAHEHKELRLSDGARELIDTLIQTDGTNPGVRADTISAFQTWWPPTAKPPEPEVEQNTLPEPATT